MKRCKTNYALLAAVAVLVAGCQQPSGPGTAGPLAPGLPMNSTTRVPPPPTGHIGAPNPYVQGQAAAAAPAGDRMAASNGGRTTPDDRATQSGDTSPLQPVGYVASPSLGPAMATPSIPAEAFVGDLPPADSDIPLRPHLRGMEPIDLVPVQQVSPATGGEATASVSAGAAPSSPAQAYRPTSAAAGGDSWAGAGSAAATPSTEPQRTGADDAAAPQSPAATQSVGDTLPWRKPTTAR